MRLAAILLLTLSMMIPAPVSAQSDAPVESIDVFSARGTFWVPWGERCVEYTLRDGVLNEDDVCDYTPLGAVVQSDGTLRADCDGDCDVDLADFGIMQEEFTGP